MTTIAYDGRFFACDTRRLGNYIEDYAEKMRIIEAPDIPIRIIACAGSESASYKTFKWFEEGADLDNIPNVGDLATGGLIWQEDGNGGTLHYTDELFFPIPDKPPAALGTGSNIAMGAMLHGATAMQAVEYAKQLDPGTGGDTLFIDTGARVLEIRRYEPD
jgi:hypothetical protein